MKQITFFTILFLLLRQISFSQDTDTISGLMEDFVRIQKGDTTFFKSNDSISLTEGVYKIFQKDGTIDIVPIDKNGELTGIIISTSVDGYKKMYNYNNGVIEGLIQHWDNGILLLEDKIENGKQLYSKMYFTNGEIVFIKLFKNGKATSAKEYYANRKLKYVYLYENNKIVSEKNYFKNGKIEEDILFIDDINYIKKRYSREGTLLFFDDTKKQIEQHFNDNKVLIYEKKLVDVKLKKVEEKKYSDKGKLKSIMTYVDDLLVNMELK